MFPQRLKGISANKYLFLILTAVLIFFYPIFKGQIPFPGDLLVNFYEPYKAYPLLGYQPGAVPSKDQGADVVRHMFPWKSFAIDSIKQGEIPFWNPHNFSGNPLMANFQSGIFYPINVIFLLLPFLSAWTTYIVLSQILAAFFMFLYLREIKLSSLASSFGGLVFAFSSYMVVWMEYGNINHTFLWLPLGLFFTEKILKASNLKYNLYLILTLFVSLLAGYIQGYFYIGSIVFTYFLARNFLDKSLTLKKILLFVVTLIFPVLLSSFQILPTKELFEESTRINYTLPQIEKLLNPWWYAVTTIAPNFFGNPAAQNHWFSGTYIERVSYIGLIPFLLSVYGFLNFRKRSIALIFGIIGIISFLLSLDIFVTRYLYQIPIPVISTTVPTRILSIFQFCAAVLAAIGLGELKDKYSKRNLIYAISFVLFLLVLFWSFAFLASNMFHIDPAKIAVTKRNLIIPTGLFLSFALLCYLWFKKFKFVLILIFALTLFELFYFFQKITPFSQKEFVYPQTPVIKFLKEKASVNRFWGYGSGYIESNFQTYDGTYSPEGVDPLHIRRYASLLNASSKGELTENLPRPDANLAPGYGLSDLRENQYRQRLLNLLGIKYVLHKSKDSSADNATFSVDDYNFIYNDGYYQIYENKNVLPRAFLASKYVVEKDEQKIVDKIFDPNFELGKTLILEEDPGIKLAEDSSAIVKIDKYTNNKVLLSTFSKTNTLLFLSDTHSPEWKVRIDHEKAKLYRADFAFRAVSVPSGNHRVEFYYSPDSFYNGLKISLLSLAILIVLYSRLSRYEKKK
ncbi:MAG: YfhO family protein [Candidatus Levybacteria bacterium]|nr:YfhO family protein [Candidatus Levybacteria bacterium]